MGSSRPTCQISPERSYRMGRQQLALVDLRDAKPERPASDNTLLITDMTWHFESRKGLRPAKSSLLTSYSPQPNFKCNWIS